MADLRSLVDTIVSLPTDERHAVMVALAKLVIKDHNGEPTIPLSDSTGVSVGYLIAPVRAKTESRPLTPEEEAENARRLKNRDNSVSADEIMVLAKSAGHRVAAKS